MERERGKLLERTEKGENRIAGSFALLGSVRYCYVCLWSLSSSGPAGQNVRNGRQRSERASSSNLTLEAQPNERNWILWWVSRTTKEKSQR